MAWCRTDEKPLSEPIKSVFYWRIYASLGLDELTYNVGTATRSVVICVLGDVWPRNLNCPMTSTLRLGPRQVAGALISPPRIENHKLLYYRPPAKPPSSITSSHEKYDMYQISWDLSIFCYYGITYLKSRDTEVSLWGNIMIWPCFDILALYFSIYSFFD